MAVKIRLSRGGSKKRPFYRIVAADVRAPRDGRYIERLGSYNPMLPKDHAERLSVDVERAKHWLSTGAEPTDRIIQLFSTIGLVEKPAQKVSPKQALPKSKAVERAKEKAEKAAKAAEASAAPVAPAPVAEEVVAEVAAETTEA